MPRPRGRVELIALAPPLTPSALGPGALFVRCASSPCRFAAGAVRTALGIPKGAEQAAPDRSVARAALCALAWSGMAVGQALISMADRRDW